MLMLVSHGFGIYAFGNHPQFSWFSCCDEFYFYLFLFVSVTRGIDRAVATSHRAFCFAGLLAPVFQATGIVCHVVCLLRLYQQKIFFRL
jgi:hypothetical protein